MPNSGKWHHCNNKWHGGFSWETLQEWRTHLFVQKIAHVNWGKFWIGHAIRLVYAKGFGQFDWYHVSNPDQSFPLLVSRLPLACSSYDIPWVGREACWTGRVKNQMASLIVKVETFVHLKERRGHKLNYRFNETSSPCLNFLWKFDNNEIESQVSSQYTFDRFCE